MESDIFKNIFTKACNTPDVTDILISPKGIVMRINGEIVHVDYQTISPYDFGKWIDTELSKDDVDTLMVRKSLDKSIEHNGKRFRIQIFQSRGTWAIAARRLKIHIPSFEDIGIPEEIFSRFFSTRSGLILVGGPNGMGKTTTVASVIERINNTEGCHIITIEDPIEYLFENKKSYISQREVGLDTPSFAQGLKDAVRANPDIIFLGEMRDPESAEIALLASETGNLVISTIHAPSAKDTISRVVGLFPEEKKVFARELLSYYLHAVINQRLIPINGRERKLIFEGFQAGQAIKHLIRNNKDIQINTEMETIQQQPSLTRQIRELLAKGIISRETAIHFSPGGIDL